ncbi:MAG: hypothetical protein FWD58_01085 [Firmicutes bacterium]|nr:hypothetical protein [Bacillota bacterium]
MTKRIIKIITVAAVAALILSAVIAVGGCVPAKTKSEPLPADAAVFVGREYNDNATVVVFCDDAAYVGYLKGNGTGGYATFEDRFTRLTLSFDGEIYKVTNLSSLWQSAVMHGSYPQGFVFNEDGSMSWVSVMTDSEYNGPSVTLNGIKWPIASFTKMDGVEVVRPKDCPTDLRITGTTLGFESSDECVWVEQTGANEVCGFEANPIDLADWGFTAAGAFEFRLRSLGGIPTYGEDGLLKSLTVASDLSTSYASFTVAQGEQLATPQNLSLVGLRLSWDPVPNADHYTTSTGFGNSDPWATVTGDPKTVTVIAHRAREVEGDTIIFYPSSEPATFIIR